MLPIWNEISNNREQRNKTLVEKDTCKLSNKEQKIILINFEGK